MAKTGRVRAEFYPIIQDAGYKNFYLLSPNNSNSSFSMLWDKVKAQEHHSFLIAFYRDKIFGKQFLGELFMASTLWDSGVAWEGADIIIFACHPNSWSHKRIKTTINQSINAKHLRWEGSQRSYSNLIWRFIGLLWHLKTLSVTRKHVTSECY